MLSADVRNERFQRQIELLIQNFWRNPARANTADDLRTKPAFFLEASLAKIESRDLECDQSCCRRHQLQFPQESFATLGRYSRNTLQICWTCFHQCAYQTQEYRQGGDWGYIISNRDGLGCRGTTRLDEYTCQEQLRSPRHSMSWAYPKSSAGSMQQLSECINTQSPCWCWKSKRVPSAIL